MNLNYFQGKTLFQFTPLREGRHYARVINQIAFISIHAPPRGATGTMGSRLLWSIFQFTPLREGRHGRRMAGIRRRDFNSRPSARGDVLQPPCALVVDISIHAPPRGATTRTATSGRPKYFNSRPSARGDLTPFSADKNTNLFQFTPLREGRRWCPTTSRTATYFNSRPSARGDRSASPRWRTALYFNSRPSARGDKAPGAGGTMG